MILIPFIAFVYFLPTIVALTRGRCRHGNPTRVFLINLLLGWTVIGWFAAMIYVAAGEKLTERQHRELIEAVRDTKQPLIQPAPQPADPRAVDTSRWSRADREKWQRAHA
jgi:hypothetical protein